MSAPLHYKVFAPYQSINPTETHGVFVARGGEGDVGIGSVVDGAMRLQPFLTRLWRLTAWQHRTYTCAHPVLQLPREPAPARGRAAGRGQAHGVGLHL